MTGILDSHSICVCLVCFFFFWFLFLKKRGVTKGCNDQLYILIYDLSWCCGKVFLFLNELHQNWEILMVLPNKLHYSKPFLVSGGGLAIIPHLLLLSQKVQHRDSDPVNCNYFSALYFKRWETWMVHICI